MVCGNDKGGCLNGKDKENQTRREEPVGMGGPSSKDKVKLRSFADVNKNKTRHGSSSVSSDSSDGQIKARNNRFASNDRMRNKKNVQKDAKK